MRRSKVWLGAVAMLALAGCGDDTTPSGSGGSAGSGGGATGTTATTTSSGASVASTGVGTGSSGAGGEGTGGDASGGGGSGGGSSTGIQITWEPCPLFSNGDPGPTVECATIAVPSHWDDLASPPIDFFVKRVPASVQPARAQVWYLQGGPGYGGDDFDPLAEIFIDVSPDVDQYIPDHRGTARSSRLGCAGEAPGSPGGTQLVDDEWDACFSELEATWGDALTGFSMTNAARDVGEVIAATRADGQQVVVFGGSYGSAWANRYLTLYPDQPTAVGMSAVAVNTQLDAIDRWFDGLGERWMDLCSADSRCRTRLGDDAWATMTETLDAFDGGSCPEVSAMGFNRRLFQQIFASFYYAWNERALIAPLVYRLGRCNAEDVAAIEHFAILISTPPPPKPNDDYFSILLSGVVTLSEFWSDPPPTLAEIDAFRDGANVALGLPEIFAAHDDAWPRYELDETAGVLAPPADHMLLFSGDLDFTPAEAREATIAHFEGPTRPFVLLPRSAHTLFANPVVGGPPCGFTLLRQLIDDPEGDIDTGCAENIQPIQLDPPADLSQIYLGVADAWGDSVVSGAQPSSGGAPTIPSRLYRELTFVREQLARSGGR